MLLVDLSWKANRGMKPGDDGGSVPLTRLFLLRRSKIQHPSNNTAAPRSPSGIPTPSPIFWCFVSPALRTGGEAGSSEALTSVADRVLSTLDNEWLGDESVDEVSVALLGELVCEVMTEVRSDDLDTASDDEADFEFR